MLVIWRRRPGCVYTRARVLDGVKNINPESERERVEVGAKAAGDLGEKEKNRDPLHLAFLVSIFGTHSGALGFLSESRETLPCWPYVLSLGWLCLVEKFPFALKRCDI